SQPRRSLKRLFLGSAARHRRFGILFRVGARPLQIPKRRCLAALQKAGPAKCLQLPKRPFLERLLASCADGSSLRATPILGTILNFLPDFACIAFTSLPIF